MFGYLERQDSLSHSIASALRFLIRGFRATTIARWIIIDEKGGWPCRRWASGDENPPGPLRIYNGVLYDPETLGNWAFVSTQVRALPPDSKN